MFTLSVYGELERTRLQLGDIIIWRKKEGTLRFTRGGSSLKFWEGMESIGADDKFLMYCIKDGQDFFLLVKLFATTHGFGFEEIEIGSNHPAYRFIPIP